MGLFNPTNWKMSIGIRLGAEAVEGIVQVEVVLRIGEAGPQFGAALVKGIGDLFQKNETENDVLVLRRIHGRTQLIGRRPERSLEFVVHAIGLHWFFRYRRTSLL